MNKTLLFPGRFDATTEIHPTIHPPTRADRQEAWGIERILKRSLVLPILAGFLAGSAALAAEKEGVPFDRLGAEAQKHLGAQGSGIVAVQDGARLTAELQDLEAEATPEGLWMVSKSEEDAGRENRFRVRAMALGRGKVQPLDGTGHVRAGGDVVAWERDRLVEEYRITGDGVRQDFVVGSRPAGKGPLVVELGLDGVKAKGADYGAELVVEATGRILAYHRLHVEDAAGKTLAARMEVADAGKIRLEVEDDGAVYPVRIDPTFSDVDWISMNPEGIPGANGLIYAMVIDGKGNLYAGGSFSFVGKVKASRIARWNGSAWSALGSGVDHDWNADVIALAVDGKGNLYAGGRFDNAGGVEAKNIARWNGSAWSALGSGVDDDVYALAVDGKGNLYAGGVFEKAGGVEVNSIARWNGSVWSALGSGVDSGSVSALAVDGKGNLYAGGWFNKAGGVEVTNIARWNGSVWSALGSGVDSGSVVSALAVDGKGNLYAGGRFNKAGGVEVTNIARWNGSAWSALGTGVNSSVQALAVDGKGNLYAGGVFEKAGGVEVTNIARWNGSAWSALGSGVGVFFNNDVYSLAVDGKGNLYAGGSFEKGGGVATSNIARWNGSAWSALGSGVDGSVYAFAVDRKGNLYTGGRFGQAGGIATNNIARWNGSAWSALGAGMDGGVEALAVDGKGNLYAGGWFEKAGGIQANKIAMWNGTTWRALGAGVGGTGSDFSEPGVLSLVFDVHGNLYVAGDFSEAGNSLMVGNIAKWNGKGWEDVGDSLFRLEGDRNSTGPEKYLTDVVIGRRGEVYVSGGLTQAIWDDEEGDEIFVDSGFVYKLVRDEWLLILWADAPVYALALDAQGRLHAGGSFSEAEGIAARCIARWNGSAWSALGSGVDGVVEALAVDGKGNLYAGGFFQKAGGIAANNIARWNGSAWSALDSGVDRGVEVLAVDGKGNLFVGGDFLFAGGKVSPYLARADIRKFLAASSNQTVTFAAPAAQVFAPGKTLKLNATASSGLPVVFTSSNASVATVQGNVLTIRGAGTVSLTASQPGNTDWNAAAPVTRALVVAKGAQKIVFGKPGNQKFVKDKTFTLTATSSANLGVVFTSSAPKILSITGRTAKMLAKGTVTITATQPGNRNWNAAKEVKQTIQIN